VADRRLSLLVVAPVFPDFWQIIRAAVRLKFLFAINLAIKKNNLS